MLYLYYGENTYLLEEKLRAFKERYRQKFGNTLNVYELNFGEDDPEGLRTIVETRTMFESVKLVFVENISGLSTEMDEWVRDLCRKNDVAADKEVVLVCYERGPTKQVKKAKKLFAYISKYGTVQEFTPLTKAQLGRWANKYVTDSGGSITPSAVTELVSRAGEDMVRFSNELDKLFSYTNGTIDEAAVTLLVPGVLETDIFKTIDALAARDGVRALQLLQEHEEVGDDPFQLFGMFAYELRVLLLIKEATEKGLESDLQKKHGLHPFVVKKNRTRVRAFSMGELLALHSLLAETDVAIKTGRAEPYEGLEDVVLAFTAPSSTPTS